MSDNTRLGISITATNTANASIAQLMATVKGLQGTLRDLGGTAADAGGKITTALTNEIAAINKEIAARGGQVTAIKQVTTALHEQAEAAAVVHRTLQQGIDASFGVGTDRAIKSAAESARVLTTSLNAAAEADARLRDQAIATTLALERQGSAVKVLSGEQFFGAFQRKLGIGGQALSAEASAAAFQKELGAVGGGLTLTPAVGFGKTVAELAGVKQSYLSAAESAKVFQAAGVTAAESVAAASVGARVAVDSGGTALLQRESRHIVGLFDSLARGQRGQAISSIGAAARDAGLGIAALSTSMIGLVAIMGGAAILRGAESMGKWATETRAAASAAGMGLESYSQLQGALSLSGLKANEADAALRRLAVNLSAALADPASLAAQAFHNLGISQADLIKTGGDAGQALKLLADAFVKNADGAAKSSNMNEIFGRGFENIIPALQNGSTRLTELQDKAKELGLTLTDDTAVSLEKTGDNARLLGETISGNAKKAFIEWQPQINAVIDLLRGLSSVIGTVVSGIGRLSNAISSLPLGAMADVLNPLGAISRYGKMATGIFGGGEEAGKGGAAGAAGGEKVQPPPLTKGGEVTVLESMRREMAQAGNAAAQAAKTAQAARQAEGQAEIAVMQRTLQTAQLTATQRAQIETELANKQISLRNSTLAADGAAANRAAKQSYADFANAEKLKIAEADNSSAKIRAIYDEWIAAANEKYKQHVSVIEALERQKVQAINTARLSEIKSGAQEEEQQARLSTLNSQLQKMASGTFVYSGQKTSAATEAAQSQGYIRQAAEVAAMAQKEIADLIQVRDTAEQGSATQKAAAQEILSVEIAAKTQEVELYKKAGDAAVAAANKAAEVFTKFFDSVGSAFETFTSSAVKALVAPQTTIIKQGLTSITESMRGTQLKSAFASLVTSIVSDLGKSVETALGHVIAGALSGGTASSIGELLGNWLSKAFASVFPSLAGAGTNVAGAASTTAAVTAGAATTSAAITAGATATATAVTGGSASVVGAIGASTSAIVTAITASSLKPSVAGFSLAGGGIIPSAAGGMVGGTGGTLAILHAREMVLPAPISLGIQRMIQEGSGGGGTRNNANLTYSPTINNTSRGRGGTGMTRGEFSQMLSSHSGGLLGETRNMIRNGFRPA
jgi:hypothetical protein